MEHLYSENFGKYFLQNPLCDGSRTFHEHLTVLVEYATGGGSRTLCAYSLIRDLQTLPVIINLEVIVVIQRVCDLELWLDGVFLLRQP